MSELYRCHVYHGGECADIVSEGQASHNERYRGRDARCQRPPHRSRRAVFQHWALQNISLCYGPQGGWPVVFRLSYGTGFLCRLRFPVAPLARIGLLGQRFEEMDGAALKPFRGGWCLGSEEFKQKMIELMAGKLGENQSQMRTNSNLSQLQP